MTLVSPSRTMAGSGLASLLVHLLAAAMIPALAWLPSNSQPLETISFMHIERIVLVPPERPRPQPRPAAPHHSVAVVLSPSVHVELAKVQSRRTASPPPAQSQQDASAPIVADNQQAGNGTAVAAQAAPQATATPAQREVASIAGQQGGYLPFGAQQPVPVLDPGVLKQLSALGVHVTLVITVGDDGKTKKVDFEPPVDPQIQKQIESLLADANWDPAVCGGGITCEGQATIKL